MWHWECWIFYVKILCQRLTFCHPLLSFSWHIYLVRGNLCPETTIQYCLSAQLFTIYPLEELIVEISYNNHKSQDLECTKKSNLWLQVTTHCMYPKWQAYFWSIQSLGYVFAWNYFPWPSILCCLSHRGSGDVGLVQLPLSYSWLA